MLTGVRDVIIFPPPLQRCAVGNGCAIRCLRGPEVTRKYHISLVTQPLPVIPSSYQR